jgi:hypothetical protein
MTGAQKDIRYVVVEVDPPEELDFDLEAWLADLLVDYWLSGGRDDRPA